MAVYSYTLNCKVPSYGSSVCWIIHYWCVLDSECYNPYLQHYGHWHGLIKKLTEVLTGMNVFTSSHQPQSHWNTVVSQSRTQVYRSYTEGANGENEPHYLVKLIRKHVVFCQNLSLHPYSSPKIWVFKSRLEKFKKFALLFSKVRLQAWCIPEELPVRSQYW